MYACTLAPVVNHHSVRLLLPIVHPPGLGEQRAIASSSVAVTDATETADAAVFSLNRDLRKCGVALRQCNPTIALYSSSTTFSEYRVLYLRMIQRPLKTTKKLKLSSSRTRKTQIHRRPSRLHREKPKALH